jgi:hypothetical protein
VHTQVAALQMPCFATRAHGLESQLWIFMNPIVYNVHYKIRIATISGKKAANYLSTLLIYSRYLI